MNQMRGYVASVPGISGSYSRDKHETPYSMLVSNMVQ